MVNSQMLVRLHFSTHADVINLRQHHQNISKMDQITLVAVLLGCSLLLVRCALCAVYCICEYCIDNISAKGWNKEVPLCENSLSSLFFIRYWLCFLFLLSYSSSFWRIGKFKFPSFLYLYSLMKYLVRLVKVVPFY